MALFAAIDRALQMARSSSRLSGAFDAWKKQHHALSFFGDVDDFIDWWEDSGVPKDRVSSAALKALCIETTAAGRNETGSNGASSQAEDAALLLLGVLIPKLRSWIRDAGIPAALDQEEAEAEIAAGLWEAVVNTGENHSRTASRLMNAARRRVRGAARREIAFERFCRDLPPSSSLGLRGSGQPEDVIELALEHEIVNLLEADLIVSTRLCNESLRTVAWRHQLTPKGAELRRARAEARLVAWVNGERVPSRFATAARRSFLPTALPSDVSGLRETDTDKSATGDGEEVISVSSAGEPRRPGATTRPAHETGDEHGSG